MAYGSAVDDLIKPSSSHCSFQHQSSFNAELARLTFHGYIIKRPIACSPALRNSDLLTSSPLPSAKIISIKTAVFSLLASATIVAAQAKCADNYQAKTDDVQACADQLRDKGTEECAIVGDVGNNVCQIGEAKIQITSPDYTVVDESSYWYAGTYFKILYIHDAIIAS